MGFDVKFADLPGAVVGPSTQDGLDGYQGSFTLDEFMKQAGVDELRDPVAEAKARKAAAQVELARRKAIEECRTTGLVFILHALGFPEPVRQYRFAAPRRWRFDLAWPDHMAAIELQGIGHARKKDLTIDSEKLCTAASRGWTVFPAVYKMLDNGSLTSLLIDWWDRDPQRQAFRHQCYTDRACYDTP